MTTSKVASLIAFSAVGSFIIVSLVRGAHSKKKIRTRLKKNPQHEDEAFARKLSGGHPERADVAVRVRKVLSKNLEMPLDGVSADDRLDDDLGAELAANPHLFWDLEAEFGIKTDVEDLDAHQKSLDRLVTFGDLVSYVQSKLKEPPPARSDSSASDSLPRLFDYAIRSIPILCLSGLAITLVGAFTRMSVLIKTGSGLFMGGFAVWGLANGGGLLWKFMRGNSLKDLAAHPWATLFSITFISFFLSCGVFFLWMIAKAFSFFK